VVRLSAVTVPIGRSDGCGELVEGLAEPVAAGDAGGHFVWPRGRFWTKVWPVAPQAMAMAGSVVASPVGKSASYARVVNPLRQGPSAPAHLS
jgi:hypothetical protein